VNRIRHGPSTVRNLPFLSRIYHLFLKLNSSVGIATGYGLDDRGVGVLVPIGSSVFSSPRRPDRHWGPRSLLCNEYRGLFPRGKSGRGVKLTTHLQLLPRSGIRGSIHPHYHTSSWRRASLVKHRDNYYYGCTWLRICEIQSFVYTTQWPHGIKCFK
jgi:hypothetical protein